MNQDQSHSEQIVDASLKQVMQALPPVIRSYISEGKGTMVAKSLMIKYALRIDQAGVLEREIMLLLMGIETPVEFTKSLAEDAKLGKETIENIVRDLDAQVFMPLKERMRSGAVAEPELPKPTAPQSSPIPTLIIPKPSIRPPLPAPRNVAFQPKTLPPTSVNKLLEDHEESHIEFTKVPMSPVSPQVTSFPAKPPQVINRIATEANFTPVAPQAKNLIPTFQSGSPSLTSVAPKMQPDALSFVARPPQEINRIIPEARFVPVAPRASLASPTIQPKSISSVASTPVPPKAPVEPVKPYLTDPYRESFE